MINRVVEKSLSYFILVLLFSSTSFYALADASRLLQPFVSQSPLWNLNQLKHQSELYDCGLEADDEVFCSDEIRYYKTQVQARLFVDQNKRVTHVQLTSPFNSSAYTELPLNLRKDGFQIIEVMKAGQTFSVEQQLTILDAKSVDKALVQFINQGSSSDPIEIRWRLMSSMIKTEYDVLAVLISKEKGIDIHFHATRL